MIKNIKNFIFPILIVSFLVFPISSFAQNQTANYGHSNITETSVVMSGNVSTTSPINLGFAIVFGSNQALLLNVIPILPDFNGNYSILVNNLLGDTNYYYKVVYGPTASSMGPVKSFKTSASSLIINHKNITQTGATIFGSISPGHPNFLVKYGVTQSVSDGSFSVAPNSAGVFEEYFPVSFPPNTTIYYRAVNPLLPLIVYSPVRSFKTLEERVTFEFRAVASSYASVFGHITPGMPPIAVLLSSSGLLGSEFQNDPIIDEDSNFQANFNGLEPETTYYVRVAKRSDLTYTYLVKSFTTTHSDVELQFFNITDSSMKVSGDIPFGAESIVLCFATNPTTLVSAPDCGSGPIFDAIPGVPGVSEPSGKFETTITNLASNTTYYFVARNSSNTNNISDVFDVTTFPPAGPTTIGNDIDLPEGPASLVPCSGLDCDFEQLMELVNNIIDFLLKTLALPLFALLFAYVGWLYMSSADDPGQRIKAKGILKSAVIGFIIAMAAFLIIKTILASLGYSGISFGILPV